MKAEYINAYIVATRKLFDVMFNISRFDREIFTASSKPGAQYEVSGIIGVTGDCTGIVVLTFSKNVAAKMVSQMIGEEICECDEDACDAIGEMVNIIAGNANRELENLGLGKLNVSVPTVLIGSELKVKNPKNVPFVCIGFDTDLGSFAINVSLSC